MPTVRNLAPVVLFVYARPAHTRNTVEALAANDLATETDLVVYSDAALRSMDVPAVQAVRDYLKTIDGFRSVTIYERARNFGLADSIIDGVTATVNDCGKVIVVEDDLITSSCFLRYMNDALCIYENEERVMHVAAHMFDIDPEGLPDTFFLRQSSCWGWGTWARAWQHFRRDSGDIVSRFGVDDIRRFNLDGTLDYWSQLLANHEGRLKTWAVYWYASVYGQGGLCLHPRSSLVDNVGHDGSGTNCGVNPSLRCRVCALPVMQFPEVISEHIGAMERYQGFLRGPHFKPGLAGSLHHFFKRLAAKLWWNQ